MAWRSIWVGSIEQGYVAKKITLHMDEIGWGLVGTSVDDDFFARKILLYLFQTLSLKKIGQFISLDDGAADTDFTKNSQIADRWLAKRD